MCYKKPGPRCSAHAAIALDKAAKRYKARPTAKNHAKMMEMRDQYDTTPAGQKMLKDFIKREDIPFDHKLKASLRLTIGELKRRDSYARYQSRFGVKENRKIEKANAERYAQEAAKVSSDFVQRVENSLPEVDTSKPSGYVDAVMTPDQVIYLEWMRTLSTKSTTEVLTSLTPGVTYAPVETSDGTFAFKCPKCEKPLSDEDADEILGATSVTCACGYIMSAASDAWVIPYDKHGVLSDPANVTRTTWFHVSKSSTWDEAQNSAIHVGTRQSAMDRARDIAMGEPYNGDLHLYEVSVDPTATIDNIVFPDMVEAWDDVAKHRSGDVTRYVNAYEDPGSVSLIVNSSVATMNPAATVNVDMLGTPHVTPLPENVAA